MVAKDVMKLKNLPHGQYTKTGTNYVALIDGFGCTCDNCGRLISNLVYVQHESGKRYTIGQDCAKTLFSDYENKQIDAAIKAEKIRQSRAKKQAEDTRRQNILNEFLADCRLNGLSNSNINSPEGREIHNAALERSNAIHGFYITWKR